MSIKRLYISKGIMTLALGGIAFISLTGNKEESKKEIIPLPIKIEEMNPIIYDIENIKQREVPSTEEIKEMEHKGRYDYIPFEHMKRMEEDIELIKKKK